LIAADRRGTIRAGFSALANWRLAAILLIATVVPSVLVASAFWPALRDGLGGTLAGDHVLSNDPLLAPTDLVDFLYDRRSAVAGTLDAAWVAALAGVLVQIAFAGGFVRALGRGGRARVADFVEGSLHDFWHNLKVFLLFALAAAIALGLWTSAGRGIAKKAFENSAPGTGGELAVRVVTIVGALLLFAALSLWQDFARAARRIAPGIGAWRAYGFARRRLAGRHTRALGLFAFWLVVGGAALLLLVAVSFALPASSGAGVLLLFAAQLAALSVRPLTRVAAWGSYIALLDQASAPDPQVLALSTASPLPSSPPALEPREL
jgi:hypothetical protein